MSACILSMCIITIDLVDLASRNTSFEVCHLNFYLLNDVRGFLGPFL